MTTLSRFRRKPQLGGREWFLDTDSIRASKGKVFKCRITKHKRRTKRIMMLKTKASGPAKVCYAGALPGLLYGAELWGVNDKTRSQMRAEALRVQGLCTRGGQQQTGVGATAA